MARWFRKLRGISRIRPRALTVAVVFVISAILVLANLTDDYLYFKLKPATTPDVSGWGINVGKPDRWGRYAIDGAGGLSYGWPLYWHQYVTVNGYGPVVAGWRYSPGRLAANMAMWFVMAVAPAAACEWLLRRYRPRLRWSLRSMLGAVGLVAACLGWFVWARDRANKEDALIDAVKTEQGQVWMERWGPKWLDLIGADRYRRRIAAVTLRSTPADEENQRAGVENLLRLSRLPNLKYLVLEGFDVSAETARALSAFRSLRMLTIESQTVHPGGLDALGDSLADMPRLRVLSISPGYALAEDEQTSHECLTAVGKASQLESLRLCGMTLRPDSLARLSGFKNLKLLTMKQVYVVSEGPNRRPLLSELPALPQLETIDVDPQRFFTSRNIGDDDLRSLVRLPRLKSLRLVHTDVTEMGLAQLASLPSLEELTICGQALSSTGLESLLEVKHLKGLHISMKYKQPAEPNGTVEMWPSVGPGDLEPSLRALRALRRTHSGIVIDGDWWLDSWEDREWVPAEYDTPDRLMTSSVRELVQKWKEAGCPPFPPASGMF